MNDAAAPENSEASAEQVTTVAATVLGAFFDALAKVDDLEDISANLKKLVLEDGVFAEPSIRAVLFPDAP